MINYFIEKMTNIFNCFYNYIYYYYYKYSFSLMIKVSNWTNEAVKTLELIIMMNDNLPLDQISSHHSPQLDVN
jgi:hypothetical protein